MFELFPAGFLVSGPKSTRHVSSVDGINPAIEEMSDEEGFDRDDYTATEVFHIGWRGSLARDAMPKMPKRFELIPKE